MITVDAGEYTQIEAWKEDGNLEEAWVRAPGGWKNLWSGEVKTFYEIFLHIKPGHRAFLFQENPLKEGVA